MSSPVERREGSGFTPRLAFGLLLIVVGVLYTFDNLGWLDADFLFDLWPMVLVVAGLGKLFWPGGDGNRLTGFLLVGIGAWMQLTLLDLLDFGTFDFWPLLVVFLGGYIAWQGLSGTKGMGRDSGDTVSAVAVLGGVTRSSNSVDFRGGDLFAFMGGCEVDLRDAKIATNPAVIDAFAFWGGVEIKVPDDWTVVVKGIPLLGGYEDNTRNSSEGSEVEQRLVVKGFAIMGGVEIKN